MARPSSVASGAANVMPPNSKLRKAREESTSRWIQDLDSLRKEAQTRFGDVAWTEADGSGIIWAHKAILYARSTSQFLSKYLQGYSVPTSASTSSLLLPYPASSDSHGFSSMSRSVSPGQNSFVSTTSTIRRPFALDATDKALLESVLEFLYTSRQMSDAYDFFFAPARQTDAETPIDRLREDLLFMWRAKLYADAQIQLCREDEQEPAMESDSIFVVHRAILCSRVPYFASQLLSSYSDSDNRLLTLPSPPFLNAASFHFVLGYIYTGTLSFANRTFDLLTSFNIWRCAAYLNMDCLQREVEAMIEDLSINLLKPDAHRCAKVFRFACEPDVGVNLLAESCRSIMSKRFGEAWREEIGNMDQKTQQVLVTDACAEIIPKTAIDAIRQIQSCRDRLSNSRGTWTDHISAMLVPVEQRLQKVLGTETAAVVTSDAFVGLLEGRTFSSDVLEKALSFIIEGLEESSAAKAYQAIVGNVLLREDGIPMDARVFVEDCRQDIIKYLKKRWMSTKSVNGFAELSSWALKEIADELDVKTTDLLQSPVESSTPITRTGLKVTPKKSMFEKDNASTLRESTLNRNAARTTTTAIRNSAASTTGTTSRPASSAIIPAAFPSPRVRAVSATSNSTKAASTTKRPVSEVETIAKEHKTVSSANPTYGRAPSINSARAKSTLSMTPTASTASQSASGTTSTKPIRTVKPSNASSISSVRSRASLAPSTSAASVKSLAQGKKAAPRTSSNTELPRPQSTMSVRSVSSAKSTASKSTFGKARRVSDTKSVTSISASKPKPNSNGKTIPAQKSAASLKSLVNPAEEDKGTSLNVGIPCIVTMPGNKKCKASVLYLGLVPQVADGQWVGVELEEDLDISFANTPDVQRSLGRIKGVEYFKPKTKRGLFVRPQSVMFLF